MTGLPPRVAVVEVGPRDGLQNEAAQVSVDDRVAFCDALLEAGLPVVEVTLWETENSFATYRPGR